MKIDNFTIGKEKTFIIAELSANHNGSLTTAIKTVEKAKECGADAIKLQTYTPDTITLDCDNEHFQVKHGTIWDGQTLHSLYKQAYTPWEWHKELQEVAKKIDLIFFSSPFDDTSVDFLEELKVPVYKLASPEITDIPLIEKIGATGKPVIISTGIADISDIEEAIKVYKKSGGSEFALLKCVSAYPAPYEDMNLKNILTLKEKFSVEIGLSDHSIGISVPIAAVSLGAKIIEKHFILNKDVGGPDASFSMEPKDFSMMVKSIREVEKALGSSKYTLTEKAIKTRDFSKSLFISEDIKKGEKFTKKNLRSIRPGYGLHPRNYNDVLGKKASEDIAKGTPLKKDHLN